MHVRLRTHGFVNCGDLYCREHLDGDVLRDCRFAFVPAGGAPCGCGGHVVVFQVVGIGGGGGNGGGEAGGSHGARHYREGQEGDVVFLREADGGAVGGEGGAEGAVEVGQGNAEVDDVVR